MRIFAKSKPRFSNDNHSTEFSKCCIASLLISAYTYSSNENYRPCCAKGRVR